MDCFDLKPTVPTSNALVTKVVALFQDGLKGGLEELIDNSISAVMALARSDNKYARAPGWKPTVWVGFFDNRDDQQAALVIQDNGVGSIQRVC
jgi:hypothetical protein